MQQIFKRLLNYCNLFSIFKIVKVCINSIFILTFLSGCNLLLNNQDYILTKLTKDLELKKSTLKIDNYNNYSDTFKKYYYNIFKGENIGTIINKTRINRKDITNLIKTDSKLNTIKSDQLGRILKVKLNISDVESKIYAKHSNSFLISDISSHNTLLQKTILIKKKSNFFKRAYQAGLKYSEINDIVKAMQWQIDFRKLDIGSNFHLLFLHNLLSKKNTLIGVKFNNFGRKYYSIRASNGNFYDINGFSKKDDRVTFSFLKQYRISSQFNLHRLHPVTHRISRHLGVDLAMPQGTPILASDNGKIIKAHFNKIAGFYIAIKHKNKYVTRYMHLKKILVKVGNKVKKGQKIALSGNTGRTTGPHLHYEIWINNHAINPINSKLLPPKELTEQEKKIYLEESKKILKYLR